MDTVKRAKLAVAWWIIAAIVVTCSILSGCAQVSIKLEQTVAEADEYYHSSEHLPSTIRLDVGHYNGKYLRPYSTLQHHSNIERGGDEPEENVYRFGLEIRLIR